MQRKRDWIEIALIPLVIWLCWTAYSGIKDDITELKTGVALLNIGVNDKMNRVQDMAIDNKVKIAEIKVAMAK